MGSETPLTEKSLSIRGKLRISCGDTSFCVDFQERRTVVEFPTFSQLLKTKSEIDSLRESISRLPLLPSSGRAGTGINLPEFRLTVRGRSIGKLDFQDGGIRFHLTPFDFITKRMSQ